MSKFTDILNPISKSPDLLNRVSVPDDWMQGRTFYGGLSAAICLTNTVRNNPELPPLRTAQFSFIGPADGIVDVKSTVLRQGRSVSFINADISTDKGLATRAVFCFGASRPSFIDRIFTPKADLISPVDAPEFVAKGNLFNPEYINNFDIKLATGGHANSGEDCTHHGLWIRHKDKDATDLSALLALADIPAAVITPMFPEPAGFCSMTWYLDILSNDLQTDDGWWFIEERADHASGGYSSQDMVIRNSRGDVVVVGRQNVAVFI